MSNLYIIKILALFLILTVCPSCTKKSTGDYIENVITKWIDKEILFPDSLIAELQNSTFVIDVYDADYKIFTILNAENGCTSCQMMLKEWERLMALLESIDRYNISIQLIFVIESPPTTDIRNVIKHQNFKYPIIYDPNKEFEKLNEFPQEQALRTFLLDENNKVKVVGNPIITPPLYELYNNVLSQDTIGGSNQAITSSPCVLSNYRIPLGYISMGKRVISSVSIKNITDSTIHINNIISSCACISTFLKKETLIPGAFTELKIFYEPEDSTLSEQEQYILRNVYIYFDGVDNPELIELYGYSNPNIR